MSYEPTNWKTGDVVTSAKLNKLEQGVAGAGGLFVVHASYNEQNDADVLDHTAQELLDAINDGKIIIYLYIVDGNAGVRSAYQGTMTDFLHSSSHSGGAVQNIYNFRFVAGLTTIQQDGTDIDIPKVDAYVAHSLDEYPVMQNDG